MTPAALAEYLHTHMPISRAMAVSVVAASVDEVVVEAPLEPNINVHGTMFGGSIATLALLAAWSVVHLRLKSVGFAGQLVVHRSQTEYLGPINGTALAIARLDLEHWDGFIEQLQRHGKARIGAIADVLNGRETAARLSGEFVALGEPKR